jgi:hypothetical protein
MCVCVCEGQIKQRECMVVERLVSVGGGTKQSQQPKNKV